MGEFDTLITKGALTIRPSDDLSMDILLERGSADTDGTASRSIFRPSTMLNGTLGYVPPSDPHELDMPYEGYSELEWNQAVLKVEYEIPTGTITSITGARDMSQDLSTSIDGSALNLFVFETTFEQDQLSQEIRYSGNPFGNKDISITIGAYYFEQDYWYKERRSIFGGAVQQALSGGIEQTTWALFSHADYHVSDTIMASFGVRYTKESKDALIASLTNCDFKWDNCTFDFDDDETWSNVSPRAGIQWRPNENINVYGSIGRGFRSGGFNLRNGSPQASAGPYDEEQVTSFEIGVKSDLLDGKVRLNGAIFNNEYDNLQRTVMDDQALQSILNAASATIRGVEVELSVMPLEKLSVNLNYGYTDAFYDSFEGLDITGDNIPDPELSKDLDLPLIPENTLSLTAIYDLNLGASGVVTFRGSYSFVDTRYINNENSLELNDYELYGLSATWVPDDNWRVSLYGKNLGNEYYAPFGSDIGLFSQQFIQPPRNYGVDISYAY